MRDVTFKVGGETFDLCVLVGFVDHVIDYRPLPHALEDYRETSARVRQMLVDADILPPKRWRPETRPLAELAADPEYMRRLVEAMDNLTVADIGHVFERIASHSPTPENQ